MIWYPPSEAWSSGFSHTRILRRRKFSLVASAIPSIFTPTRITASPAITMAIKGFVFGCTTNTMMHEIPITIMAVLRLSVRKRTQAAEKPPHRRTCPIPLSVFISLPILQISTGMNRITAIFAISDGCSCWSNGSLIHRLAPFTSFPRGVFTRSIMNTEKK